MSRISCRRLRGMVYTMTNETNNKIVAFNRFANGQVSFLGVFETGGSGTAEQTVDPLVSQGSIILSQGNCFLFAVNASSNNVSSFRVLPNGELVLRDVQSSNGVRPNSLAVYRNLLFVTNVGDINTPANVTGFWVNQDGQLSPIAGSTKNLSTANPQPTCIVFSQDGSQLAVSEKNTNRISVFNVNAHGTLSGPVVNNSSGAGPFGAAFLSFGPLLVTEVGPNALSSYYVNDNGTLNVISPSILNGQAATCWVAISRNEKFAYTANAGSGTISIYRIFPNGVLRLAGIVYSSRCPIAAPIDTAVSQDGCNLYVLNGDLGTITEFAIKEGGLFLIPLQFLTSPAIPVIGAQGMAVI